jgi:glyoxylase-like metal-dependent hydrolase (beta-lactamase superfamily II)
LVNARESSNCFILRNPDSRGVAIIDPGNPDCGEIAAYVDSLGLSIDYVILTHEHFDHISGVGGLKSRYPFAIVASAESSALLPDPRLNLSYFALLDGKGYTCPRADIEIVDEKETLPWGSSSIGFIKTPGHTPGSMSIVIGRYLFTGDALIPGLKTVVRLPGGDRAAAVKSIDMLLSGFDGETLVCPGHGDPEPLSRVDRSSLL